MNQGTPVRTWMVQCFFVDHVVVMGAEQGPVVGSGGSAAGPVGDVVGFAPGGGDGAAGEGAALVAGDEGFAEVGREEPGGPADVQDPSLAAEQDGDDVGVAGDLPHGRGRDGPGEQQRAGLLQRPGVLQGRGAGSGPPAAPAAPAVSAGCVPSRVSRSR